MRKWEDIIKDKLEEIDDALPDSVFAEFQKRRDNASPAAAPVRRRSPLVWAVVPAVAAGLAAVLFLRPTNTLDEDIKVLDKTSETVAQTVGPVGIELPEIRSDRDGSTNSTGEIQEIVKESPVSVAANNDEPGRNDESALNDEPGKNDESALNDEFALIDESEKQDEPAVETPVVPAGSPYIPEKAVSKRVKIFAPATGVVAGGGLIAALVAPLVSNGSFADADDINYLNNKSYADKTAFAPLDKDDPTSQVPADALTGAKHAFPLKVGLSVGIPVARRLNVTTGVDYSRYVSKFTYSHSGDKTQVAQYVGIPVRLDWSFASMKWLDAYVGAGVEGDICVGAKFAGRRIRKDGLNLSLLGAGGLQFNVTRHIGLYVEPQLSWAIPSEAQVLDTYRNTRPLMFSAAGGVRISLD
jgi:opacity protein-like surface antigen